MPSYPAEFTMDELRACVAREVQMRKTCYAKWDRKPLAELSPGRQKEIAMMEAIGALLAPQNPVLTEGNIELLRDNASFCNDRTRELLDRLLTNYERLLNLI